MGNQLEEEAAWKGLYILAGRENAAGGESFILKSPLPALPALSISSTCFSLPVCPPRISVLSLSAATPLSILAASLLSGLICDGVSPDMIGVPVGGRVATPYLASPAGVRSGENMTDRQRREGGPC